MPQKVLRNYINGEWVEYGGQEFLDVRNPATGEVLASCPDSSGEEVKTAVKAAKNAFWKWRSTIPTRRAEVLYTFREKVAQASDEIAEIIVREHGKTMSDAKAEMVRSLQYIEHPIGISELLKGDYSEDIGTGVDEFYIREPLGVFAVVPPYNFPAMIPLYFTWPIACGNTIVLKPSELCPMTTIRLVELLEESGLPKGVLNVVNGGAEAGHKLITHPDVVGVTFVGSSSVAESVYKTATSLGKRVQSQGGAKNHALVMGDVDIDRLIPNLLGSCFDHTSQRCFAISNILVTEDIYEDFAAKFVHAAKQIKLGFGLDPEVTMGPVVNRRTLERLVTFIEEAVQQGANLIMDGRNPEVPGYPNGCFIGPTILEAEPGMKVFTEEVFGPVRCLKVVKGMDEAIEIINNNPYGHTAVIYTNHGGWARKFVRLADVGQVGVNVGTPAPMAFYPVGGRRASFYGAVRGRANDAIDFYTDKKVVVQKWAT